MVIDETFPFKTVPYKHQLDCLKICADRESYAIFMEMGCGKSKVVVDNAAYLWLIGQIQGQVVVAPKGVYMNWVENELPTHMSTAVVGRTAFWSSYAKKEEREAIAKLHEEGNFLRTLVINVEAMNSPTAVKELVSFLKRFRCMLTVDESTTIKNHTAKRTKAMIEIGRKARFRRICSGNPMPNGPLDIYSQTEFLQEDLLGYANYFAFRNRFAIMHDQRFGNRAFKHVVGFRDLDKLQSMMRRFSFIIKKQDCLDLPPKVYQVVNVEMGPNQRQAYNSMLEDSVVKLEGSQVTAQMVITQLLRLHQISCGFVSPDDGVEAPLDEHNPSIEALLNVLEQAPGKVTIWATYQFNIRQIIAAISERFGKESVLEYYGPTSTEDRRRARVEFQDPNSPVKYIVSNPDTGKFGNTWTQATTVVYYSNSYNLESREQSEDRAHRIGQEGALHSMIEGEMANQLSVLYVDLLRRGTVDEKILKVLRAKKKLSDEVVSSNWRWLLGDKL